jgi:hypothetical protein
MSSPNNWRPLSSLSPRDIANPAPVAKQNLDIPAGVKVDRWPGGQIGSPNSAGSYVDPAAFRTK